MPIIISIVLICLAIVLTILARGKGFKRGMNEEVQSQIKKMNIVTSGTKVLLILMATTAAIMAIGALFLWVIS